MADFLIVTTLYLAAMLVPGDSLRDVVWPEDFTDVASAAAASCADPDFLEIKPLEALQVADGKAPPLVQCITGAVPEDGERVVSTRVGSDGIRPDIFYVNSVGGDSLAFMEIGRNIRNNGVPVIIHDKCLHACAAYIIPAASQLFLHGDPVIIMSGGVPRSVVELSRASRKKQLLTSAAVENGYVPPDLSEVKTSLEKAAIAYPGHVDTHIVPEVEFFAALRRDEGFVTRVREKRRDLWRRFDNCKVLNLNIVLGPVYLERFGVKLMKNDGKTQYADPKSEISVDGLWARLKAGDHLDKGASYVFDMTEEPFWVSGQGFVGEDYCILREEK